MENLGKSERIIESIGCGRFQVTHFIIVGVVGLFTNAIGTQLMAFGNYNPGWRCLDPDNATVFVDHSMNAGNETFSFKTNVTSEEYTLGECSLFDSCKHIEFNPEASTLVTEWGLACNKAWIASFIVSLQMIGYLIGACLAGVTSDAFGRKWVINIAFLLTLVSNTISIFSTSWQMFAALRFLLGISLSFQANLYYIYVAEFVTMKWRAIVLGMPAYPMGVVIFGITCLLLKDWRHIQIATTVIGVIGLVPAFWLPESLRWLEVKNKTTEFHKTANMIAKCNNKMLPPLEQLNVEAEMKTGKKNVRDFLRNIALLFRKGYRKNTIIISVPWFSVATLYYAIAFGIKALSGNFYLNIIMFYGVEVVIDSFLMFAPNVAGRKKAGFAFCGFSGICLLMAACFQKLTSGDATFYGVTVPVMFGRIAISAFWVVLQVITVEIYPTVCRGAANSWGLIVARFGGMISPILIPTEASTVFICYAVMGALGVISAILVLFLPETRGKALQERFEVKVREENKNGETVT